MTAINTVFGYACCSAIGFKAIKTAALAFVAVSKCTYALSIDEAIVFEKRLRQTLGLVQYFSFFTL